MFLVPMLDGLPVAEPAVNQHDRRASEVDPHQAAFTPLARIADRLIAGDQADESDNEEDSADPKVAVLPPNRF